MDSAAMFLTALLSTPCDWDNALTYGNLLVNAYYVQLHTLYIACFRRTTKAERNKKAVKDATEWVQYMGDFVNGFATLMCQVVVKGMNENNKESMRPIVDQRDSPLFVFVCCPIHTMAKSLFGTKFDWNAAIKVVPFQFVKNLKSRIRDDGISYSLAYLTEKAANKRTKSFAFLKGAY
jgi:hypothetical protein